MIHSSELPPIADPQVATILKDVYLYEDGEGMVINPAVLVGELTWHPQLNMAVIPNTGQSGQPTGWMRGLVFHATQEEGDLYYRPGYIRKQMQTADIETAAQRQQAVITRAHGDGFYTGNRAEVTDSGKSARPIGVYVTRLFNLKEVYDKRMRFVGGMLHLARMVAKESIAPHIPGVDTVKFAEQANRKLDRAGAKIALINQAPRHRARYMDFDYEGISPQYMLVRDDLEKVGEVRPSGQYEPRQLGTIAMYAYGFTRAAWNNARDAKHHGVRLLGGHQITSIG